MIEEKKEIDAATGQETTGHEWDGIKELNTPMPRWWLWTFYATIAFSALWVVLYPAIPLVDRATGGILGYSSRGEVAAEIESAREANLQLTNAVEARDFAAISADPELQRFALRGGAAIFRTDCAQCHGAGAAGAKGYPNLLDDAWLWGGDIETIRQTIAHGIRSDSDPDTRYSEMPAFGDDDILSDDEIAAAAEHVLALSGQADDAALAEKGAEVFADNCAACHGEAGGGDIEQGAPALNDAIWLYGGDRETIVATITHSRFGVMPAWAGRLTEAQLKKVALYVHSLGGGE